MNGAALSAIVVSYNTRDLTLHCLRVLQAELRGLDAEIWVVDNASSDGSAAAIRAAFPGVRLLEQGQNTGFGRANNAAMERARGRVFLLLNSDAFPRAGAVRALCQELEARPRAALVGPRLLNRDGSLQRSCWRFPSPAQAWRENLGLSALLRGRTRWGDTARWAHDTPRAVDFVSGACLLVRREVWQETGGFDPAFWMYAEETDWQKRMRTAGWQIWFTPRAEVEHWGGASASDARQRGEAFFAALDRYTRKHHGTRGLLALRAAMLVGNAARLPLWALLWLLKPSQRASWNEKMRLAMWLLRRQSRHWRAPKET